MGRYSLILQLNDQPAHGNDARSPLGSGAHDYCKCLVVWLLRYFAMRLYSEDYSIVFLGRMNCLQKLRNNCLAGSASSTSAHFFNVHVCLQLQVFKLGRDIHRLLGT